MNTIFITGSSSGIGKATAKLFAEKGWRVIATMRAPEKENELTTYKNVILYPLDVTKPKQIKNTVQQVLSLYDVDVLFNNVGAGMKARLEDIPEDVIYKSFETNLLGMIRVTQAFIPHFKKRKSGTILTTTSLAGIIGLPLDGFYAADKWGMQGLCEMLYFELAPYNIAVKTLVPGVVKTNFKMEQIPWEGYEKMMKNQIQLLMPEINDMELPQKAAADAYTAVTDGDHDRMCYVTGKIAKQLYDKRQHMTDDEFRRYLKGVLLA